MNRFERWSRRKRGLAVEQAPDEAHARSETADRDADTLESPPPIETGEQPPPLEQGDDTPPPPEGSLDHTLPDPDTLGPGSDFKAYLVPGVSAALKNRALRRLWATGNYNVRDGLDDYDLDYSQMRKMTAETSENVRRWGKQLLDEMQEPEEKPSEPSADATTAMPTEPSAADAQRETPTHEPSSEKER